MVMKSHQVEHMDTVELIVKHTRKNIILDLIFLLFREKIKYIK